MGALQHVAGLAGWFVATLLGATFVVQALLWLSPGDPIDLLPNGQEMRPALEAEWGLDLPLGVRYLRTVGRALSGDLGTSLTVRPGAPVAELVGEAASRSGGLVLPALLLSLVAAISMGWLTAGRRTSPMRGVVQIVSVAPVFLLAYLLVIGINESAFALIEAGRIDRPEWFALPDQDSWLRTALAITVLAVGSGCLTELHAACEDELVRVRNAGFIDAARARGAPLWPHILPNLIPPLATLAAGRIAFLLGGLVIVEKVLLLNGAGALMWEACLKRDYPLAMGLSIVAALTVALASLLGDLVRVAIDPRLRRSA